VSLKSTKPWKKTLEDVTNLYKQYPDVPVGDGIGKVFGD